MKTYIPKLKYPMHPIIQSFSIIAFSVLLYLPAHAAVKLKPLTDSILINKTTSSKKYKIKIYPGTNQETVFFTASGETGKVYQFFLFDLDGRLIKQTQIHNKETTVLANFAKGCYTFEVFSDDERIENGTMTIR